MALNLPDIYIELLCCSAAQPGDGVGGVPVATIHRFDPAKYDGTLQCWFEVTCENDLAATQISLVDVDTGQGLATLQIPSHGSTWNFYTYRVEFTPPNEACNVGVLFYSQEESGLAVSSARIRIRPTGATKARIQWPMLAFGGSAWDVNLAKGSTGCSMNVYTSGEYLADFKEGVALDKLPVWKLESGKLDTVSGIEFRALSGINEHSSSTRVGQMVWSEMPEPPVSALFLYMGALFYSDDNGVTMLPAGEPPGIEDTYRSFYTGTDEHPWTFSQEVDGALFGVAGRRYYWGISITGGAMSYFEFAPLGIIGGMTYSRAVFEGYSASTDGVDWCIMVAFLTVYQEAGAVQPLSIAVFDRVTDSMIPGSEISWTAGELGQWKSVSIDPEDFPLDHEIEVRCNSPATSYSQAPYIGEAELYFDVDPISVFTSWQRCGKGSINFGWGYPSSDESGYPTGGQSEYCFNEFGGVSAMSRLQYHAIAGAEVRFQCCATSWGGQWFDPNDPGIRYEYMALWDDGENDSGARDGEYRVDASMQNWLQAELEDFFGRVLKTSGLLTGLVDGNRYCVLQPDDEWFLTPQDAYVVMTVEEGEVPPEELAACLGVSGLSIVPETQRITGAATGENAVEWQLIRVSDSQVVDTGSGTYAEFDFFGAYNTTYQMQFAGEDEVFSTEGCLFWFVPSGGGDDDEDDHDEPPPCTVCVSRTTTEVICGTRIPTEVVCLVIAPEAPVCIERVC